jgi:hypothetical protein
MSIHITSYAEFRDDDPSTWKSPRPSFDVNKFNAELERRGGVVGHSLPRFRLKWAGEDDEYILETFLLHTGYTYIVDGAEHFVSRADEEFELPDGVVWAPRHEHTSIFTPRWVIEEWDPDQARYVKSWFIQTITQEVQKDKGGRIDVLSRYREPAEIDLQMAEHLSHLRLNLNQDDINAGLTELAKLKARAEEAEKEEFVDEIAHETVKALTDGIPAKPILFDIGKSFNIRDHTNKKLEEYNSKI